MSQIVFHNVKAIFSREFKSYFATPIALIFLTVFLMLTGFFTFKFSNLYEQGHAWLGPFFVWHPWLYLFLAPAVSMRLWSEERERGTIELLLTLPVSLFEAMLGKFFAAWAFMGLALVLTFPMVITVMYLGEPDLGVIIGGYLGSFLMSGTFLSIGCAVSAANNNQIVSFVMTTSICLLLILLGFEPVVQTMLDVMPAVLVEEISSLSIPYHFESIQRGVLDLQDFVYFITVMLFAQLVGAIVIERKKAD